MKLTERQIRKFDLLPPSAARRVRFHRVPFMFWTDGLTIRYRVFLRKGFAGSSDMLIAHELVHVGQWRRHGTAGFLRWYLGDYFHALLIERKPHRCAYFWSSAEKSARHVATQWLIRRGEQ